MLAKTALTFATVFASAALTASARPFAKYSMGGPGEVTAHVEQPVAETGGEISAAVVNTGPTLLQSTAGKKPETRQMVGEHQQTGGTEEQPAEGIQQERQPAQPTMPQQIAEQPVGQIHATAPTDAQQPVAAVDEESETAISRPAQQQSMAASEPSKQAQEPATQQPQSDQQHESHPGQQEPSHPGQQEPSHPTKQAHLIPQASPQQQDDLHHATELTHAPQQAIAEDGESDTESDDESDGEESSLRHPIHVGNVQHSQALGMQPTQKTTTARHEQPVGPHPATPPADARRPMTEHHPESESDDESDCAETPDESHGSRHQRVHGVRPPQMEAHGMQPTQMEAHGMQPTQMEAHGTQPPQMEAHGMQPTQMEAHGMQPTQMEAHGMQPTQMEAHGMQPTQMEAHGMQPTQMEAHGKQPTQMEAHGMQPTQMEADGMQPTQVEADGMQPTQVEAHGMQPTQMEARGMQPTQMEAHGMQHKMEAHTAQAAQMTTIIQPEQAARTHHSKSSTGSQQQEAEADDESDDNPGDDHPTHVENVEPPQAHGAEPTQTEVHGSAPTEVTTIGKPGQPAGPHHANPRRNAQQQEVESDDEER